MQLGANVVICVLERPKFLIQVLMVVRHRGALLIEGISLVLKRSGLLVGLSLHIEQVVALNPKLLLACLEQLVLLFKLGDLLCELTTLYFSL